MTTAVKIETPVKSIPHQRTTTSVQNGTELDILSDDYAEAEELFSVEYPCSPINKMVWLDYSTRTILINGVFICQLFDIQNSVANA